MCKETIVDNLCYLSAFSWESETRYENLRIAGLRDEIGTRDFPVIMSGSKYIFG
jgi:hypothetical protein